MHDKKCTENTERTEILSIFNFGQVCFIQALILRY